MELWKKNLYILWISQVITTASFGFGIPFIPFYIQQLGVTDLNEVNFYVGLISAAPAVTMAVMAPIWGSLSDRYGRKMMIQRAMLAASLIMGAMGFAQSANQLVFLRLLQGAFTGTITASSTFVASNTPDNHMSYALGLLSSSTFIGYSLGPIIGGIVADHFGYEFSFITGGILMIFGFLITTIFLVEDKTKLSSKIKKEKSGKKKSLNISWMSGGIVVLLVMLLLQRISRTLFTPFMPLFIQEQLNLTEGVASITGVVNGAIGFFTALAAVTITRLGDRYDRMKMIQILLFFAVIDLIIVQFSNGWISFIIPYTLLFFIIGGVEPMITSMSAQKVKPEERGSLFGIQGLVSSIGLLIAPTIGTLISINYNYKMIISVMLLFVTISLVMITIYNFTTRKNTL